MIRLFHASQLKSFKIIKHIKPRFRLILSNHAEREVKNDELGEFEIPEYIPGSFKLIEVEQENGKSTKFVLRFPYDEERDIMVVIRLSRFKDCYTVVTAWSNFKEDNHKNFNPTVYDDIKFIRY